MAEAQQDAIINQEDAIENITPTLPKAEFNPLLERVTLPGSTFQLPSRGLFYKNRELSPDVQMGEVHIHAMSAYDEILMKTPDTLFSGEAVNIVFKRCIPQILKPFELLAKDVDFLLVCLRQITYGNELELTYNHYCKDDSKAQSYIININEFLTKSVKIDPTLVGTTYNQKLKNGQVVHFRPTRFKDIIKMYQDSDPTKKHTPEEDLDMTVFAIKSVIEGVDEITNDDLIDQWIRKIPAGWLGELSNIIEKTGNFGPEFKYKTKCKECGEEIMIESPINPVNFFL